MDDGPVFHEPAARPDAVQLYVRGAGRETGGEGRGGPGRDRIAARCSAEPVGPVAAGRVAQGPRTRGDGRVDGDDQAVVDRVVAVVVDEVAGDFSRAGVNGDVGVVAVAARGGTAIDAVPVAVFVYFGAGEADAGVAVVRVARVCRAVRVRHALGLDIRVGVRVGIGVAVGIRIGIGIGIGIGVRVRIRVGVAVRVGVGIGIGVAVGIRIRIRVRVAVGVRVGVGLSGIAGVPDAGVTGVRIGVGIGIAVGVRIRVGVGIRVGFAGVGRVGLAGVAGITSVGVLGTGVVDNLDAGVLLTTTHHRRGIAAPEGEGSGEGEDEGQGAVHGSLRVDWVLPQFFP